ncbi:putative DNA pol [Leptopilina boulardi filamentous virus]|uniref:DNA-directed DNA polymerase n=1 Tax=Leptopilina boulardi filamentous virus TaxID=552509 RepID=A0A1S5YD97_9VIRU|nr:putative DNA pol [Leptopilina boulardi filamentous virus]AQQ79978.1 putative DNA pol [Leptopilina boulardi filamentous virus]
MNFQKDDVATTTTDDFRYIWLTNIKDFSNFIGIEYINLSNFKTKEHDINYKYSIFLLITECYKEKLFKMLFTHFNDYIHEIGDSNLSLYSLKNPLLNYLFQIGNCERLVDYSLLKIECFSRENCKKIFLFLQKGNLNKHWYYIINSIDTQFILTMTILFESLTVSHNHVEMKNISLKLTFYKSILNEKDMSDDLLQDCFNPEKYFVTNGIYILESSNKLSLYSTDVSKMYTLLPMISFDIETITDNMIDVPLGCQKEEKIISYVLFAQYNETVIIIVRYVSLFHQSNDDFKWKDFNQCLEEKFVKKYKEKYKSVFCWVKNFHSELHLLQDFLDVYSTGFLLKILTNDNKHKHFFTGHNIIRYDCVVLLRRLKWYGLHEKVSQFIIFDNDTLNDSVLIRFNSNAYIIDSYKIFEEHNLSPKAQLSLKYLTTVYLSKEYAKIDLDPVLIRALYIIEGNKKFCIENKEIIGNILNNFCNLNANNSNDSNNDVLSVNIPLNNLYIDLKKNITNNNVQMTNFKIYNLDRFLEYNIVDCESVIKLWEKFQYGYLFSLITNMYPCNLERALQANVTYRSNLGFNIMAIKYKQISIKNENSSIGTQQMRSLYIDSKKLHFHLINNMKYTLPNDDSLKKKITIVLNEMFLYKSVNSIIEYKTTKKKYAGAAVFVRPGFYENTIQMDVASQYPNILIGMNLYNDSVDSLSINDLKEIFLRNDEYKKFFFEAISSNILILFIAEEYQNKNTINYVTYLKSFNFVENVYNDNDDISTTINSVGQIILTYEQLENYNCNLPLLIYIDKSNGFINSFLKDMLKMRKDIQKEMKSLSREESNEKNILDAKQKFIKITVNSIYGLFGNSFIPVAALTTLIGRKMIIFSGKLFSFIHLSTISICLKLFLFIKKTYKIDLHNIICDNNESLNFPDLSFICFDKLIDEKCNVFLKYHYENNLFFFKLHRMLKKISNYIDVNEICIDENNDDIKILNIIYLDDFFLDALKLRIYLDGCLKFQNYKQYETNMLNNLMLLKNKYPELKEQEKGNILEYITLRYVSFINNLVFDTDTDGLQFSNIFHFNEQYLLNELNENVQNVFEMNNIVFEATSSSYVVCLAKKKYTIFNYMYIPKVAETTITINTDCKIIHKGYERNALLPFKNMCSFLVAVSFYIKKKIVKPISFKRIIIFFFSYLSSLKNDDLFVSIKLNLIKNDCERKRFIDFYSKSYTGSLKAVYIMENNDTTLEKIILLTDYVNDIDKYELNLGFFLRPFVKIWYQQYHIINNLEYNVKNNIVNQVLLYFSEWREKYNNPTNVNINEIICNNL